MFRGKGTQKHTCENSKCARVQKCDLKGAQFSTSFEQMGSPIPTALVAGRVGWYHLPKGCVCIEREEESLVVIFRQELPKSTWCAKVSFTY